GAESRPEAPAPRLHFRQERDHWIVGTVHSSLLRNGIGCPAEDAFEWLSAPRRSQTPQDRRGHRGGYFRNRGCGFCLAAVLTATAAAIARGSAANVGRATYTRWADERLYQYF